MTAARPTREEVKAKLRPPSLTVSVIVWLAFALSIYLLLYDV